MALFGKPKKKKKSIEVGKPRNVAEKYEVRRRLKKKYPQMFGGPEKVKVGARKHRLSADDAAEIEKLKDKGKK